MSKFWIRVVAGLAAVAGLTVAAWVTSSQVEALSNFTGRSAERFTGADQFASAK